MSYQLYEKYHQKTRSQREVIKKKNFTYRLILNTVEPYSVNRKKILDIGCGAGTLSFYLANYGNYVKGIDISPKAINACKTSAQKLGLTQNTKFQVGNFLKTKIQGDFDLILCTEIIEHLPKDKIAIKKIFNYLKPDGLVIITVPSIKAPLYKTNFVKKFDKKVGHLKRYDGEELKSLLKKTGFKILKIHHTEGPFRNFLFISPLGKIPLKFANRFEIVSDIFTFIDNISLKLFGSSQIIIVAQKK